MKNFTLEGHGVNKRQDERSRVKAKQEEKHNEKSEVSLNGRKWKIRAKAKTKLKTAKGRHSVHMSAWFVFVVRYTVSVKQ